MPYVLSEVVPETCRKVGPFATSTEAMSVTCPIGTSFHSYAEEAGKTVKVCCPMPAQLTAVASVNAPNSPATPLDCPRGSHFVSTARGYECAYCFPVSGGEACPGIPGIGRYKPTAPPTPVVTPPPTVVTLPSPPTPPVLVPLPPTPPVTPLVPPVAPVPVTAILVKEQAAPTTASWVEANWKWLAAIATAGGIAYYFTKKKALNGLDDYCAEFLRPDQFEPNMGAWVNAGCYADREGAEGRAGSHRSSGYNTRVVER